MADIASGGSLGVSATPDGCDFVLVMTFTFMAVAGRQNPTDADNDSKSVLSFNGVLQQGPLLRG
jgi:hypothetical protein